MREWTSGGRSILDQVPPPACLPLPTHLLSVMGSCVPAPPRLSLPGPYTYIINLSLSLVCLVLYLWWCGQSGDGLTCLGIARRRGHEGCVRMAQVGREGGLNGMGAGIRDTDGSRLAVFIPGHLVCWGPQKPPLIMNGPSCLWQMHACMRPG